MAGLFDLTGKTALVTGGTKGIGQSMTLGLAESGADIISLQVKRSCMYMRLSNFVAEGH